MTTPRTVAGPAERPRLLRPPTWPWWVQVLAVYGVARAVSALILVVVARAQEQNPWTDAAPSYLPYVARMWDASWYEQIYASGYPDTLPVGPDGVVQQNVWAFFPLFPGLVRGLDAVTGLGWDVLAPHASATVGASTSHPRPVTASSPRTSPGTSGKNAQTFCCTTPSGPTGSVSG